MDDYFYLDDSEQHVLSPMQRDWLKYALDRVSSRNGRDFYFEWKEGWKESHNADSIRQFLEKKPYRVEGIIPPYILFPNVGFNLFDVL